MYRLHYMSGQWIGVKLGQNKFADVVDDDGQDLDNIITMIDESTPTILVMDLEDLPEDLEYTIL